MPDRDRRDDGAADMSEEAKRAALELLDREYESMAQLFRSLGAADLDRPVFAGEGPGWRVRDLVAHFAYWQTISARIAERVAQGSVPEDGQGMLAFLGEPPGSDARNDENFRAWRERSVGDALAHFGASHARLMAGLRALPPERIVKSDAPEDWHRYFWQPGLNHLRQHRPHIESSLKEGTTA
jgi:hypothetical protein